MSVEQDQLRDMVLTFAAQTANKVIEDVRDSRLSSGYMEDEVEVTGVTWHIRVTYFEDRDLVLIDGRPVPDEANHPMHEGFLRFLGLVDDDGQFNYRLPAAWLLASVVREGDGSPLDA